MDDAPSAAPHLVRKGSSFRIADGYARLAARLRNDGPTPLYAISQMLRITVEEEGHLLVVSYTERRRGNANPPLRQLAMPVVEEIAAGGTLAIGLELPLRMTRLREAHEPRHPKYETLDLGGTDRALLRISIAATPFHVHPEREDLLHQLLAWGTDVEIELRRTT